MAKNLNQCAIANKEYVRVNDGFVGSRQSEKCFLYVSTVKVPETIPTSRFLSFLVFPFFSFLVVRGKCGLRALKKCLVGEIK